MKEEEGRRRRPKGRVRVPLPVRVCRSKVHEGFRRKLSVFHFISDTTEGRTARIFFYSY